MHLGGMPDAGAGAPQGRHERPILARWHVGDARGPAIGRHGHGDAGTGVLGVARQGVGRVGVKPGMDLIAQLVVGAFPRVVLMQAGRDLAPLDRVELLVSRLVSVALPVLALRGGGAQQRRGMAVLTWAGLRGGVSIALALTLPPSPYRGHLLVVCYAVVVFSMLAQGLTMPWVIRRLYVSSTSN